MCLSKFLFYLVIVDYGYPNHNGRGTIENDTVAALHSLDHVVLIGEHGDSPFADNGCGIVLPSSIRPAAFKCDRWFYYISLATFIGTALRAQVRFPMGDPSGVTDSANANRSITKERLKFPGPSECSEYTTKVLGLIKKRFELPLYYGSLRTRGEPGDCQEEKSTHPKAQRTFKMELRMLSSDSRICRPDLIFQFQVSMTPSIWSLSALFADEQNAIVSKIYAEYLPVVESKAPLLKQGQVNTSQPPFLSSTVSTQDFSNVVAFNRSCEDLVNVFQDLQAYVKILSYTGKKAQDLIDRLQELLKSPMLDSQVRQMIYVAIFRLCRRSELWPCCFKLYDVELEEYPFTEGGFSDVYKGVYRGSPVCVKVVRMFQTSDRSAVHKVFYREAVLWGQLSHPNILPFMGIYSLCDSRDRISLVSPWMRNGNVRDFLKANPNENRSLLVSDIAGGLLYLHENGIVHGDLKTLNILVTDLGRACIADFGLSYVRDKAGLSHPDLSSDHAEEGTVGFQAPELLDPEEDEAEKTEASDIFAFGMVCYEIFSRLRPFEGMELCTIILKILKGGLPEQPSDASCKENGLRDTMWTLMLECWNFVPALRPTSSQVVTRLSDDQKTY